MYCKVYTAGYSNNTTNIFEYFRIFPNFQIGNPILMCPVVNVIHTTTFLTPSVALIVCVHTRCPLMCLRLIQGLSGFNLPLITLDEPYSRDHITLTFCFVYIDENSTFCFYCTVSMWANKTNVKFTFM